MDKNRSLTYILSLNEFGQKICTSQTAPFKKYILDEEGNMSEYHPENSISAITIDDNLQGSRHETDRDELSTNLEDTANLGMINPLDQCVTDFEQNLMNELDSEIMSMVNPAPSYVMQHMDIRDPLSKLKKLLSQRFGIDLTGYKFRLQDMQELEDHKNLVDQCVQGEGPVQINVQIQPASRKINILDVLQPADGYVHIDEEPTDITRTTTSASPPTSTSSNKREQNSTSVKVVDSSTVGNTVTSIAPSGGLNDIRTHEPISVQKYENDIEEIIEDEYLDDDEGLPLFEGDEEPCLQNVVQWQTDSYYKHKQEELGIPNDPELWTTVHVAHWIQWAVKEFKLKGVDFRDWHMNGKQLFEMSISHFQKICPNDPGDVFWTHLELLRKMKEVTTRKVDSNNEFRISAGKRKKNSQNTPRQADPVGNNIGFNGQIQLWQFLLDLLTSKQHKAIIQWTGSHGEFKFTHPEVVAALWGERKNKPMMNYEKLSRALRYYYDGDMISKVHGKRFVYRFVCDLKPLIGYSAMELANLVKYGNPKRTSTITVKIS